VGGENVREFEGSGVGVKSFEELTSELFNMEKMKGEVKCSMESFERQ